ncbi:MarR family winged helix-turn-helix transcriptional regulator [Metabacillus halosaccharovorans]|uniref:MarR family winged helix-turn-helix transcriptional regulator n=1 Tax=Metabacillus halosaccharovorans TaxID=930124 RepID=UPI001C1FD0B5|nr:MarR family transcriptional regulator [Metabacillus halosaccharovorans]MBU7594247.1 MarR family transcriptional regulator [Metabacillus halosaccharovorans]
MLYQQTRHMTKEVNEYLQKHGLYSSQWSILYCLKSNGPMTQSDIWRYLNVEAPTITRTLVKLEESGWVKRTPGSDKRERLVSLTEKALDLLPAVEQDVKNFEQIMVANLKDDEQELLYTLLKKLGKSNES